MIESTTSFVWVFTFMKKIEWLPGEEWREASIEGDFYVSNFGRVMKLHCLKKNKTWQHCKIQERLIYQGLKQGYRYVLLNRKKIKVHRLVALAFIPNASQRDCINHIDRNRTNNHVSNLEWVSRTENNLHSEHQDYIRKPKWLKRYQMFVVYRGKGQTFLTAFAKGKTEKEAMENYRQALIDQGVTKYLPEI